MKGRLVRYRKGQETSGPRVNGDDDDDDDEGDGVQVSDIRGKRGSQMGGANDGKGAVITAGVVLKKGGIATEKALSTALVLKRSNEGKSTADKEEDAAEAAARRRALARAKMQQRKDSSSDEEDGGVVVVAATTATKAKQGDRDDDEDSSSSSSSSGGSSSSSSSEEEEDDYRPVPLLRPTFVSKAERTTVVTQEQLEQQEIEAERKQQEEEKERIEKSKALLKQTVVEAQNAAQAARYGVQNTLPPETIDDGDETEEFEKWKIRELQRMKRDRDERREWIELEAEVERRRHMSDAEIMAEDADKQRKEKAKLSFLQRYYHKGAFYQDELAERFDDSVWTAPTGQDADIGDKSVLPSVMQVRSKWGLKGRSKYTHLSDQDTTLQNRGQDFGGGGGGGPRIDDSEIRRLVESKRAGMKPLPDPSQKKKSKH